MSHNIFKSAALVIGSLSLALSVGSASAHAETFSVQEGVALNTNNNFSRIDGNPRMSIYRLNNSDNDQQFDRLPGNRGGTLLKHRSTGKCLNAHYLSQGSQINVWPCDANDADQNWNIVDAGNSFNLIKRTGTNLCVDTPTRDNQGVVHLWTCDSNNGNQRWKSSIVTSAWRLPWLAGRTATITQGWHTDGYGMNGIDIGLSAGNPVLAPIDSTVVSQCDAGQNHRAILLKASDGQRYSIMHVTTSDIWNGKTYRKGEQIGVVAANTPWNNCAQSYAPHLHFGLPNKNFNIGDYTFSPANIPSPLTANN